MHISQQQRRDITTLRRTSPAGSLVQTFLLFRLILAAAIVLQYTNAAASVDDGIVAPAAVVREGWEGIRIHPHYHHPSIDSLTPEQRTLLMDVLVNPTLSWFESVLKVPRRQSPLAFKRSCSETYRLVRGKRYCVGGCTSSTLCGPFAIPEDHLQPCRSCDRLNCTEGGGGGGGGLEETDLVVYVSAVQDNNKCSHQTVYGGYCQQDEETDRPIAGHLNICPSFLFTSPDWYHIQVAAVVHNMVHILAFSNSLFPFYRDEQGNPRNERDKYGDPLRRDGAYIRKGTYLYYSHIQWNVSQRGINKPRDTFNDVKMIVTPNVVREVQNHFNCSDEMGGELETQLLPLPFVAAENYWEKRVFGEEVMTATPSYQPVLSRITLALLHDSGWYLPDYTYGASLHWGRGQGCGFIQGSCYKWVWSRRNGGETYWDTNVVPFCGKWQNEEERCVDRRTAVGVCTIKNYPARIPEIYRYFSTRRRGGASPLVDYCPIFQYNFSSGRNCKTPPLTNPHTIPVPEVYSRDSRCFEHSWDVEGSGGNVRMGGSRGGVAVGGAGCYTYTCTNDAILVDVGETIVKCNKSEEKVEVHFTVGSSTYYGHLVCPRYEDLCENYDCPGLCSGHGNCHRGHCKCQPGYYGNDCSYTYMDRILTCDGVTCQNGGSCVARGNDSTVTPAAGAAGAAEAVEKGFTCQCRSGYVGMYCETEDVPDPCDSLDCFDATECARTNLGKEGRCVCGPDYTGENCTELLLCEKRGKPCDHGRCVKNRNGEPVCTCNDGYRGPQCNRMIRSDDPCTPSPCLNSGLCKNRISQNGRKTYNCTCPPGFKGRRCGNRKNPCIPNLCKNGGACQQHARGTDQWHLFYCTCPPTFTGEYCQDEL